MNAEDFQKSLDNQRAKDKKQQATDSQLNATNKAGIKTVQAINENTKSTADGLQNVKGKMEVTNPDLAKTSDVAAAVDAIHKLNMTTFMSNEGLPKLASNLDTLSQKTQDLQDNLENAGLKKMSDQLAIVVQKLDSVSKTLAGAQVSVDTKLQKTIDNLSKSIDAIDFKPSVNVSTPTAKVTQLPVDFSPVITQLQSVEQAIKDSQTADDSEDRVDLQPVIGGLSDVRDAITNLRFPVPNYVLPFIDTNGKATQVKLDSNGNVPTAGGAASLPSTPLYGQTTVSVTNTAVQLPSHALTQGVIIQALAANAGNVVIGDSSVTTGNGFQLQPGQATSAAVSNTNALYVNGTSSDGICFIGS